MTAMHTETVAVLGAGDLSCAIAAQVNARSENANKTIMLCWFVFHLPPGPCAFSFPAAVVRCLHRGATGVAAAVQGEAVTLAASSDQLRGPAIGPMARSPRPPGIDLAVFGLLDQVAESVLVASPIRDGGGALADFAIEHLSPGYVDPAGRSVAELSG